jgi:hypothetical protein
MVPRSAGDEFQPTLVLKSNFSLTFSALGEDIMAMMAIWKVPTYAVFFMDILPI